MLIGRLLVVRNRPSANCQVPDKAKPRLGNQGFER